MGRRLKLVDLAGMYHLMDGLTFKVSRCADVLDAALVALDKKTGVPRKIIDWNQRGSNLLNPPSFHLDGRLIVTIEQSFSPAKGNMYLSKVRVQRGKGRPLRLFSSRCTPRPSTFPCVSRFP